MKMWVEAEGGQAIAEAALVLPLLLMILMGIFMVGHWFTAELIVTAAAREGARAGALLGEWQCVKNAVASATQSLGQNHGLTFAVYGIEPARMPAKQELFMGDQLPEPGKDLQVVVTYRFIPLFGRTRSPYETIFAPFGFPFAVASAKAIARMEYRPSEFEQTQCETPAR